MQSDFKSDCDSIGAGHRYKDHASLSNAQRPLSLIQFCLLSLASIIKMNKQLYMVILMTKYKNMGDYFTSLQ